MTSRPYVVMGEAQESDSEEEINSSAVANDQMDQCKGKIVVGEAPESDEESCEQAGSMESISSAASALSAQTTIVKKKKSKQHQSILVKKLYERNASLYKNITDYITQTSVNAGNELNAANKKLLKCQMQIQEAADYLRVINSNLTALDTCFQMFLSTKYLPDIKIENVTEELRTKPP